LKIISRYLERLSVFRMIWIRYTRTMSCQPTQVYRCIGNHWIYLEHEFSAQVYFHHSYDEMCLAVINSTVRWRNCMRMSIGEKVPTVLYVWWIQYNRSNGVLIITDFCHLLILTTTITVQQVQRCAQNYRLLPSYNSDKHNHNHSTTDPTVCS